MSLEERRWAAVAVITALVSGIYFVLVLSQLARTPARDIAFQVPLLSAAVVAAVLATVANVVLNVAFRVRSPAGAQTDERDRDINRRGEFVAGTVLAVAMGVPLLLAMLEAEHFWIAHAMYLAFVLAALVGSAAKLLFYRRGF